MSLSNHAHRAFLNNECLCPSLRQAQRPDADGEPVEPPIAKQTQKPADRQSQEESDTYTGSTHPELVQALIDWRREKYQKDNVPAYIILHQKTLLAIADLAPTTKEELLTVKGFGKSKCDKYGDEILEIIRTAKSQGSNE